MSLDSFLTNTGVTHKNNPTGAASASIVSTTVTTTPIDPASEAAQQAYPTEKLFLLKECFTKYTAFRTGDQLVSDGITYAVRFAGPWAAQGSLDAYTHLVLEQVLNSQ
jgi:hypothetical protein